MKKKNPFRQEVDEATGFLLWRVHNFWQREIRKYLIDFDLTHTQFVVLATTHWLNLQKNDVTQIEIAHQAKTDVMMTSNVIRALEKKELITRNENSNDTRSKVVFLTEKGYQILEKATKKVEEFDELFFEKIIDKKSFNQSLINLVNE